MECLGRGPFDLILLDQGSGRFEGKKLLAQAMEVDVELRVLVLARSYDQSCYLQAMQLGALDYLEGPLGAAEEVLTLWKPSYHAGMACAGPRLTRSSAQDEHAQSEFQRT